MAKSPNNTTSPTGNIPPFGLRMLPELKEKIEEAAKAAGRSMNAEIVARLNTSFANTPNVTWAPGGDPLSKFVAAKSGTTVYLILDTNGYPISWDEIREIYNPLVKGQPVHTLQATIITPEMESSSERAEQVTRLAKAFRSKGKSRVFPNQSPIEALEDLAGTKDKLEIPAFSQAHEQAPARETPPRRASAKKPTPNLAPSERKGDGTDPEGYSDRLGAWGGADVEGKVKKL